MISREALHLFCRSAPRSSFVFSSAARCLHTSAVLHRQKPQRIRVVASGVSRPSVGKRIHASLDSEKRQRWEKAMEKKKELIGRVPEDDVFFAPFYDRQRLSVPQAVEIFREMATPEMLNHLDGELHVNIRLNMRTNKKTKFVMGVSSTIRVPHRPSFLPPRKILVFTDNSEEADAAKAAGALDAGGDALVAQVAHGFYHWESFDNVICHQDFLAKLQPIRKLLRDRLPSGDRVGVNILEMLELHSQGIVISSKKDPAIPEVANISLPLGSLQDPDQHIQSNLEAIVNCIHRLRSSRIVNRFIDEIEITAPPSPLSFSLELPPEPELKKPAPKSKKVTDIENKETKASEVTPSKEE